jgi:hypothetical protein
MAKTGEERELDLLQYTLLHERNIALNIKNLLIGANCSEL